MAETVITPIEDIPGAVDFFNEDISFALETCQKEGYTAQFLPSMIEARLELPRRYPIEGETRPEYQFKPSRIWNYYYSSASLMATWGRQRIIAHVPHYFSSPNNIKRAFEQGNVDGALAMPVEEFERLLSLEDEKNVFVRNSKDSNNSGSLLLGNEKEVEKSLGYPLTIPCFGSEERALRYFQKHREVIGSSMHLWTPYNDSISKFPVGRLIILANYVSLGITCSRDMDYNNRLVDGRFIGKKVA